MDIYVLGILKGNISEQRKFLDEVAHTKGNFQPTVSPQNWYNITKRKSF